MKKNVLDYCFDPIAKNYVNFDGRATRKDFWIFTLFNIIVSIIVVII